MLYISLNKRVITLFFSSYLEKIFSQVTNQRKISAICWSFIKFTQRRCHIERKKYHVGHIKLCRREGIGIDCSVMDEMLVNHVFLACHLAMSE